MSWSLQTLPPRAWTSPIYNMYGLNCMYVCMYVRKSHTWSISGRWIHFICMYVWRQFFVRDCMYVCMNVYIGTYVCIYVCMYATRRCQIYYPKTERVCMYVCMYVQYVHDLQMHLCLYMYVCTVCTVCMYVKSWVCVFFGSGYQLWHA